MIFTMRNILRLFIIFVFLSGFPLPALPEDAPQIIVDAVVASVDGQPITLQELSRRLQPPRQLTLSQAGSDTEARRVLDQIILERLIIAEADSKKMQVNDSDIDNYINEVAGRNKMNRSEFEAALRKEGLDVDRYRQEVKIEILKSRLASAFVRGNVSVSDEEVEKFLEERVGKSRASNQMQLRQILISLTGRTRADAEAIMKQATDALDSGESFEEVVNKYSEGPEKKEGGSLGIVEEKDLNPEIFDAVFPLKEGGVSKVIDTGDSLRVIKVDKRFSGGETRDERLVAEARAELSKSKMEDKFNSFFLTDLQKRHTVDKKI